MDKYELLAKKIEECLLVKDGWFFNSLFNVGYKLNEETEIYLSFNDTETKLWHGERFNISLIHKNEKIISIYENKGFDNDEKYNYLFKRMLDKREAMKIEYDEQLPTLEEVDLEEYRLVENLLYPDVTNCK